MAAKDADLDLDLEKAPKKNKTKLMLIIAAAVVVLGGGGGGAWYFLKAKAPPADKDKAKAGEAEHADGEAALPAAFVAIKENFVVNLADEKRGRIAQIGISLMSKTPEAEKRVEENMPLIKSSLLELFSAQKAEELMTTAGKEKLRGEALTRLNATLKENGSELVIDKVLFTGMVMQ